MVRHQYFSRAAPVRAFDAVTNPRMLVKWLSSRAEITPKKTGPYLLGWTGGPTHTARILEFEPGKSIGLTWAWPGVSLRGTVLRLSVAPEDDGSLLTVEHSGFARIGEWTDLYGGAEWGRTYFAMNLKSVHETGHDLRSGHDG